MLIEIYSACYSPAGCQIAALYRLIMRTSVRRKDVVVETQGQLRDLYGVLYYS